MEVISVSNTYLLIMVLIMIAVTMLLRFLPFLIFSGSRTTPKYVEYLGKVLPYAIMGMLVVYCLKGVSITGPTHGIPELISVAVVAGLQAWRRNTLISILCGTVCYMLLIQFVFV